MRHKQRERGTFAALPLSLPRPCPNRIRPSPNRNSPILPNCATTIYQPSNNHTPTTTQPSFVSNPRAISHNHLSFVILRIDNVELHGLGSSINCLGRRVASYTTRDAKEIAKLRAVLP